MRSRRVLSFVLTSGVAAWLAALAMGAQDALAHGLAPLPALAAIGFVAVVAILPGLGLSLVARLLWRAWRPGDLVGSLVDERTGGAPRLAAWLVFLLGAAVALAVLVLQCMRLVAAHSNTRVVLVLAAPALAVAGAALLAAVSRPALRGLERVIAALDRRLAARRGRSPLTPRKLLCGAAVAAFLLLALAWVASFRPQIGHLDLGFLPGVLLWIAALTATPVAWRRLSRWPRIQVLAGVGAAVALAACLGSAAWARYGRPIVMLRVWGDTRLAGLSIDLLLDVQDLRGTLHLEGIAPVARHPDAPRHDLVLVTIDTLRMDRTPLAGGPARMPGLAALGAQGTVFEWAFSPGNVTRRSLPSIATGLTAPRLRGRVAGWALRMDPRHITFAERLRAAGYDTAGFFCCVSQFGAAHRLGLVNGMEHVRLDKDSKVLAAEASRFLAARKQRVKAGAARRPLFLWFHFIEPHDWHKKYRSTSEHRTVQERYDRSLEDVDRALSQVLASVWDDPERRKRTYVVVTADHGEGLGEHGHKFHSGSLFNSEIHVPLVIAGPGIPARRVHRAVGLHDLAPTLLDLLGFVPPGMPGMDGVSFAPLVRGEVPDDVSAGSAYSAMISDRSVSTDQRAVVAGQYKLIWRADREQIEIYDYVRDPNERDNLALRRPDLVKTLRAQLQRRRASESVDPF